MNMDVQKFSMVKFVALLVCVLGVGSALAKWDGTPEMPQMDKNGYYVIKNAGNLKWFADTVNNYILEKKWNAMMTMIDESDNSDGFKDSAKTLLTAIRQDPYSYHSDPEKKALWNKAPYISYLQTAWNVEVFCDFNAYVDADYIDMENIPFTPIAAGQGSGKFRGVFDGKGVTIRNLRVDSREFEMQFYDVWKGYPAYCQNVGLFGALAGTVKNVILDNVTIQGAGKSEFDAEWITKTQISIGAIAGWMSPGGTLETCYASGRVSSYGSDVGAGGIVGSVTKGKINNVLSVVTIEASGRQVYAGGIAGVLRDVTTITSSVYDGDKIEAHPDVYGDQGGFVGRVVGTAQIKNSLYNSNADSRAYGIVEGNVDGVVESFGSDSINTYVYACLLNQGEWSDGVCSSPKQSVWSNSVNITNHGISHDSLDYVVYLIQFDANQGEFAPGAETSRTVRFGEKLSTVGITPTRSKYALAGWAYTADASVPADLGKIYKPQTVYAVWEDTYDITFNANGGKFGDNSSTKVKNFVRGDSIKDGGIGIPVQTNYVFLGWSLKKNKSTPDDNLGVATSDKAVYAVWKIVDETVYHTVLIDAQGHGSGISKRVEHGTLLERPSNLSADGYRFENWFNEASGNTPFDFSKPVISDDTVYAKWSLENYTITYNNMAGATNSGANPSVYNVETLNINLENPTKEGFDFLGWYSDETLETRETQVHQGSIGNKIFYASWKEQLFQITYKGTASLIQSDGAISPVEKHYNVDVQLMDGYFKAVGYEQDGWVTVDSNEFAPKVSSGTYKFFELGATYQANENVTLYPHWKKADYKIAYHYVDNAINFDPQTVYQRDTINDRSVKDFALDPKMHGFNFGGWYKNADLSGNKVTQIKKNEYGDVDLYAKWTPVPEIKVKAEAKTCAYNGNSCGAKVTIEKCPAGYTCAAVAASIKNVADGPIDAKIVDFSIKDASGNDVTDAFRGSIKYVESGTVSVTPKVVSFKGRDTTATFTGAEIHVSSTATSTGLLPGHVHNVGYEISAIDVGSYPAIMTAAENVKIFDGDGNDVTANYSFTDASIFAPSKGLTIKPSSELTFTVSLADQAFVDNGEDHWITKEPTNTAASGETTYQYQFEGDGKTWTNDLSSLKKNAAGEYQINVKASNPNYVNGAVTSAHLIITDKSIITVTTVGGEKTYDGTPLSGSFTHSDNLVDGDQLNVTLNTITDAGVEECKVESWDVIRGTVSVKNEYVLNEIRGTLTVRKAPLTITTENGSNTYNGTVLTAGIDATGWVNGETATVVATGSQTVVGSSKNTYSIVWDGTAKESNYEITENIGTLTVTQKTVKIAVTAASKMYGDADPVFTGVISGLVDEADLGTVMYYRTNPSEKNAGAYAGVITANYTPNPNYSVTVVPADYTIKKRNVTLTSATANKVFDGTALSANEIIIGGDGFAPNEGVIPTVTGLQINAGTSENTFTYTLKPGTDTLANYTMSEPVYGTLTVSKAPVTVAVAGHANSYVYSGAEQNVYGYDVSIDNSIYKESYFTFNKSETADSIAKGTNVGTYKMNLTPDLFANDNENFDVTFDVVSDGELEITSKPIEVAVGTMSKIYGYPDPDYKEATVLTGFVAGESAEGILDKCTYNRAPGEVVGTYTVSIDCPAAYENYMVTVVPNADNFNITQRSLVLAATAEKIYGSKDPAACSATLSGFLAGDTATVTECKFDSRVVDGNDVGDYLFTASAAKVDWGTTVAGNYAVGLGSGMLTVNRKDLVVTVADDSISYGDSDPTTYELIFEGLVAGDSKNLIHVDSIRRDAGDYPGTYTVYAYGSAVQGNYNVAYVSGTLKIRADNVVVAWYGFDSAGNPTDSIVVPIFASDVKNDAKIKTKIRTAIAQQGITPTKEEDSDSTYTYNKNWTKQETGKFVAEFTASVKQTEIVVKYGKSKKDTAHIVVDVPRAREDSLVTVDINDGLEKRGISVTTPTSEDSTYVVDYWKKNSDGVYEPVFKGIAKTRPVLVKYGESDDEIVVVNVSLVALRDESLTNKAINDCMDSLDIVPSRSGNYEFTGKWKKTGEDEYEAQFVRYDPSQDMKKIVAKYGDKASDTIAISVYKNATDASIIKAINDTLAARNITPTKANDGEYGFTFDGTWAKNATTKQYEPGFIKSKIVQIVVKYGDAEKDTVKMTINELDSDSIIEKKIEDVLTEISSMPTKEGDSTHVYVLKNFVLNDSTDMYEPVFEKKGRMFGVNFHLPSDGELLAEFNGYVYGEETLLPGAHIVGDTAWKFKGWYQKPNGIGDRYKAMRRTDYGDKDVYPLFQKTIRYETRDGKGVIEVVYTNNATRDIARALEGVIPEDYTKKNVTYTFAGWTEVNGVYKANMADVLNVYGSARVQSFNVAVNGRALEISGAKLGTKLMVFDLNGVLVSKGVVSRGTQRVELSKAGMYIVRVNNQLRRVNVK